MVIENCVALLREVVLLSARDRVGTQGDDIAAAPDRLPYPPDHSCSVRNLREPLNNLSL